MVRRSWPSVLFLLLALMGSPALSEEPTGWHRLETDDFVVLSNADLERTGRIVGELVRFRTTLGRIAPALEMTPSAPTRIFVVSGSSRGSLGGSRVVGKFIGHPHVNYIVIDPDVTAEGAFAVIFHEMVHHLLRHNLPVVPLWLNEGLAEYYSTFYVDGEDAIVGSAPQRHLRFFYPPRHEIDLVEVLRAGQGEYHEGQGPLHFYALSWAAVHHLLSGDRDGRDALADYLLLLHEGEDPERAFEAAFGWMSSFEDEVLETVSDVRFPWARIPVGPLDAGAIVARPLREVELLYHQAELLLHVGRGDVAAGLVARLLTLEPTHSGGLALEGHRLASEGRRAEAAALFADAERSGRGGAVADLLTGLFWLSEAEEARREEATAGRDPISHLGTVPALAVDGLASTRHGSAARQTLERAVAAEPGYAEAWARLGAAHRFPGTELDRGITALQRAADRLPRRTDVLLHLVELLALDGQYRRARGVAEGRLDLVDDGGLHLDALEEVDRRELLDGAEAALREDELEEAHRLLDEAVAVTSDVGLRERLENRLYRLDGQIEGR